MATTPTDDITERPGSDQLRDASKLVIDHPIPLYDPPWLRRLHTKCLWDGGRLTTDPDFCCERCAERYAEWEYGTVHVLVGREPLQTFYEQGRHLGRRTP